LTTATTAPQTIAQQAAFLFDYGVKLALDCRVVNYGKVFEETGRDDLFAKAVSGALTKLYTEALLPLGLPNLTALFVSLETRRPGNFEADWTLTYGDGLTKDADMAWRADVAQCFMNAPLLAQHHVAVAVRTKLLNW
jgi:hypothetical protein